MRLIVGIAVVSFASLRAVSASSFEVSGRIESSVGGSATNVEVTFVSAVSTCQPRLVSEDSVVTRTDRHGRYTADVEPSTVWRMEARIWDGLRAMRVVPPLFGPEHMPPLRLPERGAHSMAKATALEYGYRLEPETADEGSEKGRAPGNKVVVRVLDFSRQPLPGAMVWVRDHPECWGRADADGQVVLKLPAALGEVSLLAGSVGHEQRLVAGSASDGRVDVYLRAAQGILMDVVHDVNTQPIEDVEVLFPALGRRAWSDPQGRATIHNLAELGKPFSLKRHKRGYISRPGTRGVLRRDSPMLESIRPKVLYRPSTVVGRLVGEDGLVPSGVRAAIGADPEIMSEIDDAGRFVLNGVPNGRNVVVFEQGGEPAGMEVFAVAGAGERVDLGSVVLQSNGRISGMVTDLASNPIAGALIAVNRSPRERSVKKPVNNDGRPTFPVMATTDDTGAFRLAGLAIDTKVTVAAVLDGYVPRQSLVRVEGVEQFITLTLPRLAEQVIRVVSARDSTPLLDAAVVIDRGVPNGMSDGISHRTLRLADPMTEEIRVHVFPGGEGQYEVMMDGFVDQSKKIRYSERPEDEPLMIRLEPEAVVTGIVRDPGGVPLPGVRIGAEAGERGPVFDAANITDAEGRFEVRDLPSGPATFFLKAPGYGEQRRKVEVLAGSTTQVDLQLEPVPSFRLRGQIWIEGEGPAVGLQVDAIDRTASITYPGFSDADGWFEFDRLPEGAYALGSFFFPAGLEPVDGHHINLSADVLDWQLLMRRREPEPEE